MTFKKDEKGPAVVGDRPDDALATRRHFLKQSGVAAAAGLGGGAAAAVLPGAAVAAGRRRQNGREPSSPQSLQQVAEDAVIFGSPVVLMQRYFQAGCRPACR